MQKPLTADEIVDGLISRIEIYSVQAGMRLSEIGKLIVNDTSFVHRLKRKRDLRLVTYDRVDKWLREREREGGSPQ